MKIKAVINPR